MTTVRRAEISDSRKINEISATLGYEKVSDGEVQEWLEALIVSEEHRVWVCEVECVIVAWLHAVRSVRLASTPFIEIAGLAVDPTLRRKRIGRQLVSSAIVWADSQGLKTKVRCNSSRSQSHQFYESLGFTKSKSQLVFEHDL